MTRERMQELVDRVEALEFPLEFGRVRSVTGLAVEATLKGARVGAECELQTRGTQGRVEAELVGFRDDRALLMPFSELRGIGVGDRVRMRATQAMLSVSDGLIGRVIDGRGIPVDGSKVTGQLRSVPIYREPINPMLRTRIKETLDVGVRAINGLLTVGRGQRVAIMAGSGVGKSVLLGMMARYTTADVNVIALVGERGREVREFIERDLGAEGLKRSVVVTATSDQSPVMRMRAAYVATTVAEYFREQGKAVLLLMDSLTRLAMAQREVGLTAGEPPTTKGYPPSVYSALPKLLERAGNATGTGSITGLYTILTEGDDINDPIADAVRAIVDGHIVLSRRLATRNHFPSIDILQSISRVMRDVTSAEHMKTAAELRRLLSIYEEARDLIQIGAYVKGTNAEVDRAVERMGAIEGFVRQSVEERGSLDATLKAMREIVKGGTT